VLTGQNSWPGSAFDHARSGNQGFACDLQCTALVKTADEAETYTIHKDTLCIKQDSIPDGGCSSILESESAEIELTLADTVHQLDA
jgi:hypothetical protein